MHSTDIKLNNKFPVVNYIKTKEKSEGIRNAFPESVLQFPTYIFVYMHSKVIWCELTSSRADHWQRTKIRQEIYQEFERGPNVYFDSVSDIFYLSPQVFIFFHSLILRLTKEYPTIVFHLSYKTTSPPSKFPRARGIKRREVQKFVFAQCIECR